MPKEKKKVTPKICPNCGETYTPKRSWQLFCSNNCRWLNWDKQNPRVKKNA